MTKSLTAAELVKLAKRVAHEYEIPQGSYIRPQTALVVLNTGGSWLRGLDFERHPSEVMRAALTPEVLASEEALTRALLASAVTITETGDGLWLAEIGAQEQYGEQRDEAISRLLDALLSEAPQ